MNPSTPYMGHPGRHAAWLVLRRSDFCGRSLYDVLQKVGVTGDFDDGLPGWVDWQRLVGVEELLDSETWLSSGTRATLRICVALASLADELPRLDEHNLGAVTVAIEALASSLRA